MCQYEQKNIAFESGAYLANRFIEGFRILLFQLEGFYVELFYHPETNEIAWARSFDSTDELEPYLQNINVSDLVQS